MTLVQHYQWRNQVVPRKVAKFFEAKTDICFLFGGSKALGGVVSSMNRDESQQVFHFHRILGGHMKMTKW